MLYALSILCIVFGVILALGGITIVGLVRRVISMDEALVEAAEDYVALETGRDEETESYQQIILTMEETAVTQDNHIEYLRNERQILETDMATLVYEHKKHHESCLPDFMAMRQEVLDNIAAQHAADDALIEASVEFDKSVGTEG